MVSLKDIALTLIHPVKLYSHNILLPNLLSDQLGVFRSSEYILIGIETRLFLESHRYTCEKFPAAVFNSLRTTIVETESCSFCVLYN